MAKWTRVGEIPQRIPVNFVVDSTKYPELAAWIYAFPHGEMGKAVRDILDRHVKTATRETPERTGGGDVPRHPGLASAPSRPETPAGREEPRRQPDVRPSHHPGAPEGEPPRGGMDGGTANVLNELDQGF